MLAVGPTNQLRERPIKISASAPTLLASSRVSTELAEVITSVIDDPSFELILVLNPNDTEFSTSTAVITPTPSRALVPSIISTEIPFSLASPLLNEVDFVTVLPDVHLEELPEPGGSRKIKSTFSGPCVEIPVPVIRLPITIA